MVIRWFGRAIRFPTDKSYPGDSTELISQEFTSTEEVWHLCHPGSYVVGPPGLELFAIKAAREAG